MIWWTLALFVVSFIVTALLAPKPDIENARPDSLDNIDYPRATEDAPIPLILGKVRFDAPNTIWYGDFSSEPITERIKVSLFKKQTITVAYRYYLGFDLALAMGPEVQLHTILVYDTVVWTGSTSTTVTTSGEVSATTLFGGHKNGGGFSSEFTYYPGSFSQGVDGYLEYQVGSSVPAYRGVAHIVFPHAYIGESASLHKIAFVLSNYTNAIGAPNGGLVGEDMNPMEAIYQIMTDQWRGLGVATTLIDLASFQAAATTLFNEGNGVSVKVTSAQTGKQLIAEVLRQIDAILYQDPETGKFVVKLIRFDYDIGTLPVYDEDDVIQVRNFTKTSWEDVLAQVKVSFSSREKESSIVAIAQDMATASMIGRLKTSPLSFPFCYDPDLANRIAARELSTSSVPLFRMTVEMNRNGYNLRPGDVFKFTWPEYGLNDAVFRVQRHDLGALLDNKIVLECLQDSFAQSNVVFSTPATSGWVAPVTQPTTVAVFDLVEAPRFIGRKLEQTVLDGRASVIPVAQRPSSGSTGFDLVVGATSGVLGFRDPEAVEYPATGTLQAAYPADAGLTGADVTGFVVENALGNFEVASADDLLSGDGGLLIIGNEWLSFSVRTGTAPTFTLTGIRRGLFGTRPLDHAPGARVWHVNVDHFGTGSIAEDLSEVGMAYYKILDRVGGIVQDGASVPESSKAMADLADRPARPRNVQISASRTPVVNTAVARPLTWVASNRNADSVTYEQDAAQTPDQTETYDVQVYFGATLQGSLSADDVASGWNIPFNTLSGPLVVNDASVRVTARRVGGDLKSSPYYAWLPFTINIP